MAGRFTWLDRQDGESVRAYDNRINELAAFHSGYAFLSYENYCPEFYAFAVFAVWNDEFNKKLVNPLPEGGFMMHCDAKKAEEMCALGHGFPIFVKLVSKLGRLYVESFALADKDVVYDLYFNGCDVKKPEGHVFYGNEKPQLLPVMKAAEHDSVPAAGQGNTHCGSYRRGSYVCGSYFMGGSYRHGSFYKGAYMLRGSRIGGSFTRGSYINISGSYAGRVSGSYSGQLSGSYLSWFFGGGSYLKLLFGAGSYRNVFYGGSSYAGALSGSFKGFSFLQGSYAKGSFSRGSFAYGYVTGSYINGSFVNRYFLTGSFYNGSYHRGSFIYGGFADVPVSYRRGAADDKKQDENKHEEFVIRRLIEELGYGLDLI